MAVPTRGRHALRARDAAAERRTLLGLALLLAALFLLRGWVWAKTFAP